MLLPLNDKMDDVLQILATRKSILNVFLNLLNVMSILFNFDVMFDSLLMKRIFFIDLNF